jgi:hypothetical protein
MSKEEGVSCPFSEYSAKIKEVYVELKDYEFFHSPYSRTLKDIRFIGREKVKKRIKTILQSSQTRSGTYLVTGFRGMGKTSVVRQAIGEHNRINKEDRVFKRLPPCRWISIPVTTVLVVFTIILIAAPVKYLLDSGMKDMHLFIEILLFVFWTYCVLTFFYFVYDSFLLRSRNRQVKKYLKDIKASNIEQKKVYHRIEINLSQDDLKETDVLKRITKELLLYWEGLDLNQFLPYNRKLYAVWRSIAKLVGKPQRDKSNSQLFRSVHQKLKSLNYRISAQVTAQNEQNFSSSLSLAAFQGSRLGLPIGKISSRESMAYPIASSKEIEDELIDIFHEINKLKSKVKVSEIKGFIFIIDELDKIDPNVNFSLVEKESSNPILDTADNAPGSSKIRKRQEAVAQLLGNLKGFLNVVEAKFFFIGGREMFDASLADIADRDSFYSSIFNDIIYVNSFFKDKVANRAGVTQMTEAYLCKIILACMGGDTPDKNTSAEGVGDSKYNLNLIFRRIHLSETGQLLLSDKEVDGDKYHNGWSAEKKMLFKARLYKVMFILQNYVIYLTYRSNGTPKKLASLIEDNIVKGEIERLENIEENLVVFQKGNENKKERLFLRFKFDFQYEIGLTSDLYRPYIIANSRHLKALGDKLLFSSAFIMDHILKFHAFGFSWRNLELIPEVILVNKEPNLRRFIEELIRFLSHTYIRSTVSGIFQYRFYGKTARELMYLSKTSDLGAAAFNFTLDESLQIKRHYKRKLIELRNKYSGYTPIAGDNQFVHSLCFVQTILGDLYFYDKEYDEAVIYYTESIQTLRVPSKLKVAYITRHQLYLWVRNKLKLGLTLEKMRAYNSAFSNYRTLILDLEKCIRSIVGYWKEEDEKKESQNFEDTGLSISATKNRDHSHRSVQLLSMPFIAYLSLIEKMRLDGITAFDIRDQEEELISMIGLLNGEEYDLYRYTMLKSDYYNNVGTLLFYKNCHFPSMYRSQWEIQGKEENNEADKKGHLDRRGQLQRENPIIAGLHEQFKTLYDENVRRHIKQDTNPAYDFHPSLSALNYYLKSCEEVLSFHRVRLMNAINVYRKPEEPPQNENGLLSLLVGYLLPECIDFINTNRFYHLGSIFSKLGDAVLGSLASMQFTDDHPLVFFTLNKKNESGQKSLIAFSQQLNRAECGKGTAFFTIENVLNLYELSAAFYRRSGRVYSYAFQYKKILYLLKDVLSFYSNGSESNAGLTRLQKKLGLNREDAPCKLIESLAEEIFRSVTWNFDISNRPQILKYRQIFDIKNRDEDRSVIYNSLNNSSDIRESIILVEEIKLKLTKMGIGQEYCNIQLANLFISPYGLINNRFSRILELKYRCEWYYYIVKNMLGLEILFSGQIEKNIEILKTWNQHLKKAEKVLDTPVFQQFLPEEMKQVGKEISLFDLLRFLISESIFCMRELIKMVRLYEPGHIISFSYLAEAHRKMGKWCEGYLNLLYVFRMYPHQETKRGKDYYVQALEEDVEQLIGQNALVYLEPNYHYEIAVQNYYRSIQMHTEGRAYKAHLLNLYVLEDDFNDNLTHFSLAMERMRVNLGDIRKKIDGIKERIDGTGEFLKDKSHLYKYDSYFPVMPDKEEEESLDVETSEFEFNSDQFYGFLETSIIPKANEKVEIKNKKSPND